MRPAMLADRFSLGQSAECQASQQAPSRWVSQAVQVRAVLSLKQRGQRSGVRVRVRCPRRPPRPLGRLLLWREGHVAAGPCASRPVSHHKLLALQGSGRAGRFGRVGSQFAGAQPGPRETALGADRHTAWCCQVMHGACSAHGPCPGRQPAGSQPRLPPAAAPRSPPTAQSGAAQWKPPPRR